MPDLSEKWNDVERALMTADSIAFDGCHKIYVLMDKDQTQQMIDCGYREDGSQMVLRSEGAINEQMLERLHEWWDESCGLRFINAVRTVKGDPNEGFETLIGQFEDEDEDEDDDAPEWTI